MKFRKSCFAVFAILLVAGAQTITAAEGSNAAVTPAVTSSLAVLATPTPSSTLTGSSATFSWTAGSGASAYKLILGTSAGGSDVYNSYTTTATSRGVSGIPTKGATLYATLYTQISGTWSSNAYTYTEYGTLVPTKATLTTPAPSSTLTGSTATFSWTTGSGASNYKLTLGTTAGGSDVYNSYTTTAISEKVTGIPTTGATLYATLWSKIGSTWSSNAYTYTCATILAGPAVPLHTAGPYIVDSNGYRVRLNAVNWYGAEGSDYVVMGLESQTIATIVSQIKSRGFNAVRLPWSNELYESNPVVGNYALTANPSLNGQNALTILDDVVNALTSSGIMVILDNHTSTAMWCCTNDVNNLWYNSSYPLANWLSDWQGIVSRYKSNNLVIGVDLRNEPRIQAVWGGNGSADWHAAATTAGNDILAINPNLLIFVEGVSYAKDLSGVANTPVTLNTANRVVYEAHDYGFDYSGLTGYSNWVSDNNSGWGYLVTGSNPQPLWMGEFGTCNTATTCVSSSSNSDLGYWFGFIHQYMWENSLDWSFWAINGTTEAGHGNGFGDVETYGILNTSWNGDALSALTTNLQSLITSGGGPATSTYEIQNVSSGLVMEVQGQSKSGGAVVDQATWNGGSNQKWTLAYLTNGLYTLTNVNSGLVLDVYQKSTSMGGEIDQYASNGGSNQEFILTQTANGYYRIVNSNSGYAVEVPGYSTSSGTQLDQWGLNGGNNQEWSFIAQ